MKCEHSPLVKYVLNSYAKTCSWRKHIFALLNPSQGFGYTLNILSFVSKRIFAIWHLFQILTGHVLRRVLEYFCFILVLTIEKLLSWSNLLDQFLTPPLFFESNKVEGWWPWNILMGGYLRIVSMEESAK